MSLTSTDTAVAGPEAAAGECPDGLVRAVRAEVRLALGWQKTADRVACALRANLPDPADLLPAHLRQGDPSCYQSHLLYSEPDGSFSIAAMVWLPGQETIIRRLVLDRGHGLAARAGDDHSRPRGLVRHRRPAGP